MARKTLIHKHTNLTTTTGGVLSPKLPTVGTLEKGEIAVNYKNGYETLSIENDAGEVIPFASLEQTMAYTDASVVNADWDATSGKAQILNKPDIPDEKLSSSYQTSTLENDNLLLVGGDTYETAFSKIEKAILDNEETVAASLNDLNTRKIEIDDVPTKISELTNDSGYLTSHQLLKTINNQSIIGEGNITIEGGSGEGDTNVIETVKVNGTALTPDANKAVNIDLTDYDKAPLIIEVNNTDTTVPSGTYTNIGTALADGRDVIVKVIITDDVRQVFNCRIIADDSVEGSYLFGYSSGDDFARCVIDNTNNLTINFNSLSSIYAPKSHTHTLTSDTTISNGDKLVITDADSSPNSNKIARASLSFDGSTTTKALTPKGTWETFLQSYTETDPTVQTWAKNNIYFAASQALGNVLGFDSMHFMKSNDYLTGVFVQLANDAGQYIDYIVTSADPKGAITHGESTRQIPTLDYLNSTYYKKPSTGIPKSDLASAVQTSLGKADTALQSYTETDPVFTASVAHGITSSDISNWNSKTSNTGTITGITMNGSSKGTSGVVNLGTVITSETSLSKGTTSGSGNAVTDISVNGHTITLTKGSTFLTSHQNIKTINNNSLVGTGNISIDTLPTVTASDNGKVLQVVNGAWSLVMPTAIYSGTSTPNNSVGNNGDLYLLTS